MLFLACSCSFGCLHTHTHGEEKSMINHIVTCNIHFDSMGKSMPIFHHIEKKQPEQPTAQMLCQKQTRIFRFGETGWDMKNDNNWGVVWLFLCCENDRYFRFHFQAICNRVLLLVLLVVYSCVFVVVAFVCCFFCSFFFHLVVVVALVVFYFVFNLSRLPSLKPDSEMFRQKLNASLIRISH